MVQKITAQTKDWTMSSALAAYITLWCGCGGWGDFWLNPPLPHPPIPDTNPSCHAVLRSTESPHVFPTPGKIFRPVKIDGRGGKFGLFGQFYCHRIISFFLHRTEYIKKTTTLIVSGFRKTRRNKPLMYGPFLKIYHQSLKSLPLFINAFELRGRIIGKSPPFLHTPTSATHGVMGPFILKH